MGKCDKCWDILPPDFFCERDDDGMECVFCRVGKNYITLPAKVGGKKYTKEECKKDYIKFLNMLKEKEAVRDAFVKGKKIII